MWPMAVSLLALSGAAPVSALPATVHTARVLIDAPSFAEPVQDVVDACAQRHLALAARVLVAGVVALHSPELGPLYPDPQDAPRGSGYHHHPSGSSSLTASSGLTCPLSWAVLVVDAVRRTNTWSGPAATQQDRALRRQLGERHGLTADTFGGAPEFDALVDALAAPLLARSQGVTAFVRALCYPASDTRVWKRELQLEPLLDPAALDEPVAPRAWDKLMRYVTAHAAAAAAGGCDEALIIETARPDALLRLLVHAAVLQRRAAQKQKPSGTQILQPGAVPPMTHVWLRVPGAAQLVSVQRVVRGLEQYAPLQVLPRASLLPTLALLGAWAGPDRPLAEAAWLALHDHAGETAGVHLPAPPGYAKRPLQPQAGTGQVSPTSTVPKKKKEAPELLETAPAALGGGWRVRLEPALVVLQLAYQRRLTDAGYAERQSAWSPLTFQAQSAASDHNRVRVPPYPQWALHLQQWQTLLLNPALSAPDNAQPALQVPPGYTRREHCVTAHEMRAPATRLPPAARVVLPAADTGPLVVTLVATVDQKKPPSGHRHGHFSSTLLADGPRRDEHDQPSS